MERIAVKTNHQEKNGSPVIRKIFKLNSDGSVSLVMAKFLKLEPLPTLAFEEITPDIAKKMLDHGRGRNRPITKSNLASITTDMLADKYAITGETVIVAVSGKLLDGQHRLYSIIESKKSQVIAVARNIPDNSFQFIDTGRTRRASDVLGIQGIDKPTRVAAVVKFIIYFQNARYGSTVKGVGSGDKFRVNNDQVAKFAIKHEKSIFESLPVGFHKGVKLVTPVSLSALHYIFKQINEQQADDFCWKVTVGESLTKTNPIHLLRNELIADMRSKRPMRGLEKIGLICKTWNLYRTKKTVSVLEWNPKEEFPKPI